MTFNGTTVYGFMPAVIGMRLPMSKNYHDALSKIDSKVDDNGNFIFGEDDLRIAKNLIKADDNIGVCQPNSKFLEMIEIWVSIEAPLCFWREADTYRFIVKNSTSTMHRIQSYPIDDTCFERNPLTGEVSKLIHLDELENARINFNNIESQIKVVSEKLYHDNTEKEILKITDEIAQLKEEQKSVWYELIYGLGDSWLQTRMCHFNYATLRNMYTWRCNHKQNTWSGKDNPDMDNFINWAKTLPYTKELIYEM
jgi:hypothetical protein